MLQKPQLRTTPKNGEFALSPNAIQNMTSEEIESLNFELQKLFDQLEDTQNEKEKTKLTDKIYELQCNIQEMTKMVALHGKALARSLLVEGTKNALELKIIYHSTIKNYYKKLSYLGFNFHFFQKCRFSFKKYLEDKECSTELQGQVERCMPYENFLGKLHLFKTNQMPDVKEQFADDYAWIMDDETENNDQESISFKTCCDCIDLNSTRFKNLLNNDPPLDILVDNYKIITSTAAAFKESQPKSDEEDF